ncbi:hypothetical protein KFU94_49260 [Chloroflexi bacterium TSY]|nr:hypothetical protein [Chloroflexi bacterium TSY]
MIADRAEYKSELESITRLGRAQGISLILAAQRPSGVTDQMRSNIKFRISLRVETPGESREMLRRSDAAFLPSGIPGRGYLQVGNEEIELIQVAYTGEKYLPPAPQTQLEPEADLEDTTVFINDVEQQPFDESATDQETEAVPLYKAIIDQLNEMARTHGVEKQRAPWPDFLPLQLSLTETLIAQDPQLPAITSDAYLVNIDAITLGQKPEPILSLNPYVNRWLTGDRGWVQHLSWQEHAVHPVVGLLDNPYSAEQLPLVIDMQRGHTVLFGASGWGKTTFIRTLIVSLAATHSPDHLHAYILDLGGRNLNVLADLPHVGGVISPDSAGYEERVEQLLRELDDLVAKRKEVLSAVGAPDIYQYNEAHSRRQSGTQDAIQSEAHSHAPLTAIVVAIDNFIEFRETFDNNDDNVESVLDRFVSLARQAIWHSLCDYSQPAEHHTEPAL